MADTDFDDQIRRTLVGAWHHYLVALDPLRPQLFRYCRALTGNVWDAEDLVQDTLLKAFAGLSQVLHTIENPKAYVLRMASNLWIDRVRAQAVERSAVESGRTEAAAHAGSPASSPAQSSDLRDAAAELMQRLAPQERAAVLLREVFETTLEETAEILGTTVGATKAALHRGRERLENAHAVSPRRPRPPSAVLDRFVERYAARDLPGLLALMRDDAAIEFHGLEREVGRAAFERKGGWFHHNLYSPFDGSPTNARWQVASVDGEAVVLVFGGVVSDTATLTSVMRIEGEDGLVRRIEVYALCPDVVRHVGERLGLPTHTLGYRFPFDVSGRSV